MGTAAMPSIVLIAYNSRAYAVLRNDKLIIHARSVSIVSLKRFTVAEHYGQMAQQFLILVVWTTTQALL